MLPRCGAGSPISERDPGASLRQRRRGRPHTAQAPFVGASGIARVVVSIFKVLTSPRPSSIVRTFPHQSVSLRPLADVVSRTLAMTKLKDIPGDPKLRARTLLHKACSHPLRHAILIKFREREACPKEIADELGVDVEGVAYHVRQLKTWDLIELVAEDTRMGGTQHIYRAIVEPLIDMEGAAQLSRVERELGSKSIIPMIVGDMEGSWEAGVLDSHPQRSLLRMPVIFDGEGMIEAAKVAERALNELKEVETRSLDRLAGADEDGMNVSTAILVFESAPFQKNP
jgi:hypothetical protein